MFKIKIQAHPSQVVVEHYLGIDIGGTKIKLIITDSHGKKIASITEPTARNQGSDEIIAQIIALIKNLFLSQNLDITQLKAVGLGIPGLINHQQQFIIRTPNLPWVNFNLISTLKPEFPRVKFFLYNDAVSATWAEYRCGAGQGRRHMIYVGIGSGVGGGAVLDGKLYLGHTGNALEIGHLLLELNPAAPTCGCGLQGCWESLASGLAIEKMTGKTAQEVFNLAINGHRRARQFIDQILTYHGLGISNLITIFDPEIVVLGGGFMDSGDYLLHTLQSIANQSSYLKNVRTTPLVSAQLGSDAGALGAALLAIEDYQEIQNQKKSQSTKKTRFKFGSPSTKIIAHQTNHS